MTLDELEARTRKHLTRVAAYARADRDLTVVMNEAADEILEGALSYHSKLMRRKQKKQARATVTPIRPDEPVHFSAKCYLDTDHECHGSLACDGTCWVPKTSTMHATGDASKVTCGACRRSKVWKAAA